MHYLLALPVNNASDLLVSQPIKNLLRHYPRASARSDAQAKPGARVTNSEMRKSSAIICVGLVWTIEIIEI